MASSSETEAPGAPAAVDARPFKSIVLALDLSERTPELIRTAAYLARVLQAETTIVSVVKMSTSVRADEYDGSPANKDEERLKDSLERWVGEGAFEEPRRVRVKILHGDPADRIAEYAEYLSADLIVIGSRGYGAVKRAILGSTSSAVSVKSKTSVLIVR